MPPRSGGPVHRVVWTELLGEDLRVVEWMLIEDLVVLFRSTLTPMNRNPGKQLFLILKKKPAEVPGFNAVREFKLYSKFERDPIKDMVEKIV